MSLLIRVICYLGFAYLAFLVGFVIGLMFTVP